ncbi:bacchus [Eupeodes corollae]|uniref:bacchus n=1 Tax=Eupeodes corollae TaxID=290404 RepID=UPI002492DBB3|nr:bacchus [Eupeodes corollae]
MSSATENNGDIAVEKVAADATTAVKEDKQIKTASEETSAASDNGTTKPAVTKDQVKGTKRPADDKSAASKKAKKESAANASDCSEDEETIEEEDFIEEIDSDIESDEYDLPYDDDDENDGSGSDDQA